MDTNILMLIIIFLLAISFSLVIALVVSMRVQQKERKELLNRIFAKDSNDYIKLTQVDKKPQAKAKTKDPAQREMENLMKRGFVD
jgi:hypothetical protein